MNSNPSPAEIDRATITYFKQRAYCVYDPLFHPIPSQRHAVAVGWWERKVTLSGNPGSYPGDKYM